MNKKGAVLAGRIQAEIRELKVLVERIELGMQKAKTQSDDIYLDSVALNLHGFYSGVERLFKKIAGKDDDARSMFIMPPRNIEHMKKIRCLIPFSVQYDVAVRFNRRVDSCL